MLSRLSGSRFSSGIKRLAHATAPDVVETAAGVKAVILDAEAPVSTVSVIVKAGSRQEASAAELGLSQALRASFPLSNKRAAGWKTVASIELSGGSFDIVSSRELIAYTLQTERDSIEKLFPFLYASAAVPKFPAHELNQLKSSLKLERALFKADDTAVLFDNLHKVAFRRGLGNSLSPSSAQISAISSESLNDFHGKLFSAGNVVVVGSGVSAESLNKGLVPFSNDGVALSKPAKSVFSSGEMRVEKPASSDVELALAAPSGPSNSKDDIIAGILASLLSGVPDVVSGSSAVPLNNVRAFNFSYSDAGLFGFKLRCEAAEAGKALKSLNSSLAELSASITEDHALIGKQLYLRSTLSSLNDPKEMLEHVGSNIVLGTAEDHQNWKSTLDSVTASDLKQALDKFIKSPKAFSAVGNTYDTPYLDEL